MSPPRLLAAAALVLGVAGEACVAAGTSESQGMGTSFGSDSGSSTGELDPTSEISAANASGEDSGSSSSTTTTMGSTTSTTTTGQSCTVHEDCSDQDGNLCTWPRCAGDTCVEDPATCGPSMDECVAAECNPQTGMCEDSPLSDVPCNDGDPCTTDDTCSAGDCAGMTGICVMPDHPVISEVLYDDPDLDNDVWIELWAPQGTSLTGYTLEFVNGNGGAVGDTLALSGTIPDNGLLLIVDPSATDATLIAKADIMDTFAELQNGPDNVRLVQGMTVIDAVGYGTFGASDVFAGEGTSAPGADPGQSLARLVSYVDSDDNSADFTVRDTPTPGELND
jgi:hypothetical protein